jgi:alpha-tubulin suppressor-like RCC1 family protein
MTRKSTLSLWVFLLLSCFAFGQAETYDFITYDTSINYTCFADPNLGGCTGNHFTVRISRPRNYFVAGSADTASRPMILTMPGAGEQGTDTAYLSRYGPHYWLQHGWDGGVQLGNGRHYPILVTFIATSPSVRPWFIQGLMDSLIKRFHPRKNSLHLAALSRGVWTLGGYMQYEMTAGDEHNMANIRSFADLQGEGPGDYPGASPFPAPTFFGHWAKRYGGKMLGLEGTNDSRNIWQITKNMNDSVANAAYFSYESYGQGMHCCWDSLYDPSVTNWRSIPTVVNPHLVYSTNPQSTMGTYFVDPVTGTNLFQWMLRQGDTTLLGSATPPNQLPVANAGPDKAIRLPVDSVVVTGSATDADGTITSYVWTKASGTGGTISSPSSASTSFKGLTAGIYKFVLTVMDNNGGTGKDTMQVTVDTAYIPPTVTAGIDKSVTLPVDSIVLNGSATGHGTTIHILTWTRASGPNSPAIIMTNSNQTATIHGLIQGVYIFTLTATDNHGLTKADSTTVTVNPASGGASPKVFVAPGEYQVFFIDTSRHLYGIGTNIRTLGVSETGTPGTAIPLAVPSNLTFRTAAGCLHGGAAVDMNGNVWSWGANDQGQVGNGAVSASEVLTPVQLMTDSAGNAFTGITTLRSFYASNASEGWYAIRSDSSLWVWGQTLSGMRGNGTAGSTSLTRPAQVPVPGNRKVVQVAAGDHLIVLCSDSTVWTCGGGSGNVQNLGYAASGNDYRTLHQLTTLSGIKQIAGGAAFNYALKSNGTLYGWGYYGYYMGGTGGDIDPLATPTDLTSRLNLPHPIKSIAVNMVCTHAILSDSTLWGWGDNAQGNIGIGTELDFATFTYPYSWDYYPARLLQQSPVQVTTRKDFIAIYTAQPFVMFDYAQTADGQLYSWGRNKGGVLGNGIVGCSSDVVAAYPNSWDVTSPALVNPLSLTSTTVGPCPWCVTHPASSPCNTCSAGGSSSSGANRGTASILTTDDAGRITSRFILYPTATHDNQALHLTIASRNSGAVRINIYNMQGKLLQSIQANKTSTWFEQSIITGHLPAGMYLVKAFISNSEQFIGKFTRL